MSIDPLLGYLSTRLLEELGNVAAQQRTGRLALPVERWRSGDVPAFLDRLRRVTGDDYIGLGAMPCPPGAAAFIIDLTSRCTTLRDAITQSFRFCAMVTRALTFRLVEQDAQAIIELHRAPGSPRSADLLVDWHMIVWHTLPQRLIGSRIWLDRVEFDHPLGTRYGLYASLFGPDCHFNSDACRLHFARDLLDQRIVLRPRDAPLLTRTTSERFSLPRGIATSWQQTLIARLRTDIAAGRAPSTLGVLATTFGVSGQTLRRRLMVEGVSYRDIKARARIEAARDALSRGPVSLQDASFAAGFADPGGLGRALRTRRDLTTRQLRDQVGGWKQGDRPA